VEFKEASRKDVRIKALYVGVDGAGKSTGMIATLNGLISDQSKIAYVNTEPGRLSIYADKIGKAKIMDLQPPYSPDVLIKAIHMAEDAGFKALGIESLSDFWAGLGGVLDMHQEASEVTKNSFSAWKRVTPKHEAMFNTVLASNMHIICSAKKKVDYVIENNGGKQTVKKLGLADITREGTDYRFMLKLDFDRDTHMATATKDNTGLFDNKPPFLVTNETGLMIRNWCLGV